MRQDAFVFARDDPMERPVVAYAAPVAAQPRLSAQCARILARLKDGPMRNTELGTFCLNPRARISDLRAAGYDVVNYARRADTGESWYRLVR